MEEILKIASVGICGGILAVVMKCWRSEFAMPVALVCSMAVIFFVLDYIREINLSVLELASGYGVDISYIKIIIKVICIAYICQFASELLKDAGLGSIALKVELAARLIIFSYALPVAKRLLELAARILSFMQG